MLLWVFMVIEFEIEIQIWGGSVILIPPGPKSALEIRGDKTFLDYIVTQVEV